jgi:hypothetical protein
MAVQYEAERDGREQLDVNRLPAIILETLGRD